MAEPQEERGKIIPLRMGQMFGGTYEPGKKSPKLDWCIRYPPDSQPNIPPSPRITVYTNDPADTVAYGIISAPMNAETLFSLLIDLRGIAEGPNGGRITYQNETMEWINGASTGQRKVISETILSKGEDGVVWIAVTTPGRPKAKFEFLISDFHKIIKADGTPITKAESSVRQVLGLVEGLSKVYATLLSGVKPNAAERIAGVTPGISRITPTADNSFDEDIPF